jgi:glycosyltransferase involved in cell wall biosynthesis
VLVSNSRDEQAVLAQGIEPAKIYRAPVSGHLKPQERTTENRRRGRAAFKIPEDALGILYFGFIHAGRNIDVLIRAMAILSRKMKVHGLIIGGPAAGGEGYYKYCRDLAEEVGMGERMTWTGYATNEQVVEGLAAADVMVSLPERGADLRNTSIITGILAHLPVITTCNERYYRDKDLEELGCRYAPARDAEAVVGEIENLAKNRPSEAELGRWARMLEPEKIWSKHIEVSLRAYGEERPISI